MSQRFNSHSVSAKLGAQVRARRLKRGLTLVSLGSAVGVHHSQISRLEKGRALTFSPNVQKICTYLSIDDPFLAPTSSHQDLTGRVEALRRAIPEAGRVLEAVLGALEQIDWPAEAARLRGK